MRDSMSLALNAKIDEEARAKIHAAMDQITQLQDGLFHTQQQLLTLQQKNESLRKELAAMSAWEDRAAQYQLVQSPGRAVVYHFSGQPEHYACPTCFENQRISPLQDMKQPNGVFWCAYCDKNFPVDPVRGRGYRG
jgi:NAD-dependent SIR2 family protein deacetylase